MGRINLTWLDVMVSSGPGEQCRSVETTGGDAEFFAGESSGVECGVAVAGGVAVGVAGGVAKPSRSASMPCSCLMVT